MSQSENASEKAAPVRGPIKNAVEVIERFGGIRPMAKKIDVAVTTVQGWKKRDVIPAARRSVILEAAETYNVDLTDIMPDASPANENISADDEAPVDEDVSVNEPENHVESEDLPVPEAEEAGDEGHFVHEAEQEDGNLEDRLAAVEKTVVSKHTWFVVILIAAVLLAVAVALWPSRTSKNGELDRLSALEARTHEIEGDVAEVKEQQSFFGTLIPKDIDQQLARIQEQAGQAKEHLDQAVEKAKELSSDVMAEDAGTIGERVVKLEEHLQDFNGGSPVLAGMLEKIKLLSGQAGGQSQIDTVMEQLSALVKGSGGAVAEEGDSFTSVLETARTQNEALGQTFEGVPATDLKAAAMLLVMTQFRSSLNRDNEAFEQDLNVLMGLVDEENVELRTALERLAPHAQEGVLTPSGLTSEFKGLAGDAVVASLSGEDVSVSDRARARFNEVFQVEKNGELITGTETQATVNKAENMLDDGDLEEAIATVETLEGPAAAQMAGWLEKAQATLTAQKLKDLIGQSIHMKAYGGAGGLTPGGFLPGSSELIRNEETGINILRRNSLPNMPEKAGPYR